MYKVALNRAWGNLITLTDKAQFEIKFLEDRYSIDLNTRAIFSLSCNIPANETISVLLLHYLISDLKGIPPLKNEWISFKDVPEGPYYYPAYRRRSIEPIIRKYGENPEGLLTFLEKLNAKQIKIGDIGIQFNAFEKVPVAVSVWKKDEEFDAEANVLFDANITGIFPTEDIVVLAGLIAGTL